MDGVLLALYIPVYILEIYIWLTYYSHTLGRKAMDQKKFLCLFVGIYAIPTILTSFGFRNTNILISIGFNFMLILLLFKGNIFQKMFYLGFLAIIGVTSENLAYATVSFFSHYPDLNYIIKDPVFYFIMTVISKLYTFIIIKFFIAYFSKGKLEVNTKQLAVFLCMPISCILFFASITSFIVEMSLTGFDKFLVMCSFCGIILANILVYATFEKAIYAEQNSRKTALEKQLEDYNKNYYAMIEEKYSKIQAVLHDNKNHLNCLYGLLEMGNIEKSWEYVKKIDSSMTQLSSREFTDNKVLNIILNDKSMTAEKNDIEFNFYMDELEINFITDMDICTIFGNLLDNALEAAILSEDKVINIDIHPFNQEFVMIKIENSCIEGEIIKNGKLESSKPDKENHGIGLGNVRKVVANYQGSLKLDHDQETQTFSAIVMLGKVDVSQAGMAEDDNNEP